MCDLWYDKIPKFCVFLGLKEVFCNYSYVIVSNNLFVGKVGSCKSSRKRLLGKTRHRWSILNVYLG
jgi:hypothetical protein